MTEQKKSNISSWRSETIETFKPKKSGRRGFLKAAGIIGGTGLLALAGRETYKTLRHLGYFIPERGQAPAAPISPDEAQAIQNIIATPQEPTPFTPTEPTAEPTAEPITQREGEFAGINFYDGSAPIDMGIFLDDKTIAVPYFTTIRFHEGILEGEEFQPYMNTAIVWRDGGGRMQIDGHSGWYDNDEERVGFNFTPWQLALEEQPSIGNPQQMVRVAPSVVDEIILNNYMAREVMIRQGEINSLVNIIAGVRVPPRLVPDSKRNITNIVPWLTTTFPNHGFEQALEEDPWKVLVVKFCGRNLQGEPLEESRGLSGEVSPFRQARFFFVLKTS
jgi:hypothetical protein